MSFLKLTKDGPLPPFAGDGGLIPSEEASKKGTDLLQK